MTDAILILNAGSSSLKFSVFHEDPPQLLIRGQVSGLQTAPRFVASKATGDESDEHSWPRGSSLTHQQAIEFLLDWGRRHLNDKFRIAAAGHRVVHGGTKFLKPVRIDEKSLTELEALVPLAPLHQPHNLAAIRAIIELAPQLP